MQALARLIYPPACVSCGALVENDFALCPACWPEAHMISGLVCDVCGLPLPGEEPEGVAVQCDACLAAPRPWVRGRSVLLYRDIGARLAVAFKAYDRAELARPFGAWMARAAAPLEPEGALVVPVPLHWRRLWARRYNQAALLAQAVGRELGLQVAPDALTRPAPTAKLEGLGRAAREGVLAGAISPHPCRAAPVRGRRVLLVDDVLTTGATLAASSTALLAAGATEVCTLTLARTAKDA
ncbi:ComF family protein [Pseudoroseicyclus sp. CLL3-39]|uniref:ComF family protein n=2 Tax=Pseudoroseicyclus tamaricis TaxID=2705421 RepID=A0A6B2JX47_9RHOB|nr:ComF family protein [Pseudoroseicyclus tamaricis]